MTTGQTRPARVPRRALVQLRRHAMHLRLPGAERREGAIGFLTSEPLLVVLAAGAAALFAAYSLWQHAHYLTGQDLGIYDQGIWLVSRFHLPNGTIFHQSLLADHFAPIIYLLAPIYWVDADARVLLLAQALLVSAAVVPVFMFARDRLPRLTAYLLSACYLLSWGISAALGFDFHEVAFAPLLIALTVLFADRRQWTPFAASAAAMLLVKEDMGLVLMAIGAWIAISGSRRRGVACVAIGLGWYVLTVHLLIPAFNHGRPYSHWSYGAFGSDLPSAVIKIAGHPGLPFHVLITNPSAIRTLTYLLIPFGLLALYSPLVLVLLPLAAEGLLSSDPNMYRPIFHHWLAIAPLLVMAGADGLHNLLKLAGRPRATPWIAALVGLLSVFASWTIASKFPLSRTLRSARGLSPATADDRAASGAVAAVPPAVTVDTTANLLSHLSHRSQIYLMGEAPWPEADYIVANPRNLGWPNPPVVMAWIERVQADYRIVYDKRDWTVWKRVKAPAARAAPGRRLARRSASAAGSLPGPRLARRSASAAPS